MKKQDFEKLLSNALKREVEAFPSPSPTLRNRLLFTPQRVRKIVWSTAIGFTTTFIIAFAICIRTSQMSNKETTDPFKPTQIVTAQKSDSDYLPTKVVY
jgi:hypothetical protein